LLTLEKSDDKMTSPGQQNPSYDTILRKCSVLFWLKFISRLVNAVKKSTFDLSQSMIHLFEADEEENLELITTQFSL
jgi:hypothetical protein